MSLILDTGPLVALLNRRDRHHDWASEQWSHAAPPFLTCEPVIAEACFLVQPFAGAQTAVLDLITRGILDLSFQVGELVVAHKGDADTWTRVAFILGANGHPQLTHAFITGMAAQNWPHHKIGDIIADGLSTTDIDATRTMARRNLTSAVPDDTRSLLYRLSLVRLPPDSFGCKLPPSIRVICFGEFQLSENILLTVY